MSIAFESPPLGELVPGQRRTQGAAIGVVASLTLVRRDEPAVETDAELEPGPALDAA